jgi:serine/threonine protein phosphatase PrpC
VTAYPDVKCMPITSDTEFVILACDGIWDVKTSQECINFMHLNCYGNNFAVERPKRTMEALVKGVEGLMDDCCAKDLQ